MKDDGGESCQISNPKTTGLMQTCGNMQTHMRVHKDAHLHTLVLHHSMPCCSDFSTVNLTSPLVLAQRKVVVCICEDLALFHLFFYSTSSTTLLLPVSFFFFCPTKELTVASVPLHSSFHYFICNTYYPVTTEHWAAPPPPPPTTLPPLTRGALPPDR